MVSREPLLRWLAALAVAWLIGGPAHALEVALQPDTEQVAVGQKVGVTVTVRGGRPLTVPTVQVADGLGVSFLDQSQTTHVVNGRVDRFVKYRFAVEARRVGSWTLGPAMVVGEDPSTPGRTRTWTSPQVMLQVVAADASRQDAPIVAETSFDRTEAWQGELILYRQAFRSRVDLASAGWLNVPTKGLLAPKTGQPDLREYVVEDEQGRLLVQERWEALLVTESGSLRWEAPILQADLVLGSSGGLFGDMFRRTRRESIGGQPLALDVRPLPPAPPGFSGLVGDFVIETKLPRTRTTVGASVDWQVMVVGNGSLEGFRLPPADAVEGVRIYEGAVRESGAVRQGRYQGGVAFDRQLVPTREGEVPVPVIELITFSPKRGEYVTLRSSEATLQVRAGEVVELDVQSFTAKDPLPEAEDEAKAGPRPIWRSGPGVRLPFLELLPALLALFAAPALGVGALAGLREARSQWARRASEAPREATPLERLGALPSDPAARLVALDEALRLAVATAVGVAPAALDRDPALAGLPIGEEVRAVWTLLDRARFAGAAPPADLAERVQAVVRALEAR